MIGAAEVMGQFRTFCVEELGWPHPEAGLDDDVDLIDAGLLDSLALLEIVDYLRNLGVDVPTEELTPDNFATLGSVASLVARLESEHRRRPVA